MSYTKEQLKEHRKLWVEALRSGEYEQTAGQLQDEHGYCCLGVVCRVAKKNGIHVETIDGIIRGSGLHDQQPQVEAWIGIPLSDRIILAHKNDRGAQFSDLADLIESKYIELNSSDL